MERIWRGIDRCRINRRFLSNSFIDKSRYVSRHSSWIKNRTSRLVGGSLLVLGTFATKTSFSNEMTDFIQTKSGLKYRNIKKGDGVTPIAGNTIQVHYTGWLNGFDSKQKFDSSVDRGEPLTFTVGKGQVIAGWDEALLTDMPVGSIREVIIPPQLGYGARGAGNVIPPNATLYFRMELVSISPPSKFQQLLSKFGL